MNSDLLVDRNGAPTDLLDLPWLAGLPATIVMEDDAGDDDDFDWDDDEEFEEGEGDLEEIGEEFADDDDEFLDDDDDDDDDDEDDEV